jgi:LysR family transcriptional regulator for metE and metH
MSGIERRHAQLLIAIEREGTISAAARTLFVTQSAASQQLRQAETRLGFALTTRTGRTVTLTPAAQRLVDAATISESALLAGEADARWLASSGRPSLRIALGNYDNTRWLGSMQHTLDQNSALAPIELVRSEGHGLESVLTGRAHAAIVPTSQPSGAAENHHVFDDDLVAIVSKDSELANRRTLSPQDFDGCHYVTFGTTPEDGFEYTNFLRPHNVVADHILRVESTRAITDIVASSNRMSILSRWGIPRHSNVTQIPLDPPPPPIGWSVAVGPLHDDTAVAATVAVLLDALRNRDFDSSHVGPY